MYRQLVVSAPSIRTKGLTISYNQLLNWEIRVDLTKGKRPYGDGIQQKKLQLQDKLECQSSRVSTTSTTLFWIWMHAKRAEKDSCRD